MLKLAKPIDLLGSQKKLQFTGSKPAAKNDKENNAGLLTGGGKKGATNLYQCLKGIQKKRAGDT